MKASTYIITTSTGARYTVQALTTEQATDIAIIKGLNPIHAIKA
jgi:hypothetical protein